jgi:hypothetical protein
MDLDHRHADRRDRVAQRDRRVGVAAGVEQYGLGARLARFVEPVDEVALVIGLADVERDAQFVRPRGEGGGDVVERVAAIDFWLAQPKQVEVGETLYGLSSYS